MAVAAAFADRLCGIAQDRDSPNAKHEKLPVDSWRRRGKRQEFLDHCEEAAADGATFLNVDLGYIDNLNHEMLIQVVQQQVEDVG